MAYHVIIYCKSSHLPEVKLDLTRSQLKKRFLEPYRLGNPITIKGKTISQHDFERIEITHTEKTSKELVQIIEAQKKNEGKKGIISPVFSDDYRIATSGTDLTDQFITGPPGSKRIRRGKAFGTKPKERIQAFLSYSTKDKHVAGNVKQHLEYWGVNVFLAHEDIRPSRQWQDEIIKRLKECHVFMPLLTKNFRQSDWTDQESGMAVVESKTIIPLTVDIMPYGFLGRYQGFKLDADAIEHDCREIFLEMRNNERLRERAQESYIQAFLGSSNFPQANEKSELLEKFGPYSRSQINNIIRGSLDNSQIGGGFDAKPMVQQLFSKNRSLVSLDLRRRFAKEFKPL